MIKGKVLKKIIAELSDEEIVTDISIPKRNTVVYTCLNVVWHEKVTTTFTPNGSGGYSGKTTITPVHIIITDDEKEDN